MKNIIRNTIAVIVGIGVGMFLNGFLISISSKVIPLPDGVNPNSMESLKENMHVFKAKNFLMPFLAHALGTLVAAFVACKIAVSQHIKLSMLIGALFLIAGFANVMILPAPIWFSIVDLVCAYIPMAYIGYKLARV
jgi:hypothetical protein